jgi:hypothetical protein
MKTRKLFYIFLFIAALAISSPGQEKSISEAEYNAAMAAAIDKMEKLPRKTVDVRKEYKSGAVSETTETVVEYLPPDKSRWVTTVKEGNTVRKTEVISLKNAEYSRENGGKWIKEEKGEGGGGITGTAVSDIKPENTYSVEEIKSGNERLRVFTHYTTIDFAARKSYVEHKAFIDDKGLVKKITIRVSRGTKEDVASEDVTTYEYNPKNLRITAPVK